jgi:hypothetical protein
MPRAWLRPSPAYLTHPRRRLPRVRGLVRSLKPYKLAEAKAAPAVTAATD